MEYITSVKRSGLNLSMDANKKSSMNDSKIRSGVTVWKISIGEIFYYIDLVFSYSIIE